MHYIAAVNEFTVFMALLSKCVVFLHNKLSDKYYSMEECVTDLWFQNQQKKQELLNLQIMEQNINSNQQLVRVYILTKK